jgi:hypothetical protein
MKYSNGDMDDLFRRASERYPLKTDSGDWGRLASALDGEPAAPSEKGEKRRRRGVFWWFLLIPLAGAGYLTWQAGVRSSAGKENIAVQRTAGKAADGQVSGGAAQPVASGSGLAGTGKHGDASEPGVVAGSAKPSVSGIGVSGSGASVSGSGTGAKVGGSESGDVGVSGKTKVRNVRTSSGSGSTIAATQKAVVPDRQDVAGIQQTSNTHNNASGGGKVRNLRTRNGSPAGNRPVNERYQSQVADNDGQRAGLRGTGSGSSVPGTTMPDGAHDPMRDPMPDPMRDPMLAALDLRRMPVGGGYNVVVDVVAPEVQKETAAKGNPPPKPGVQTKKTSHGYVGISAAPDFSTVRFQKMTGVGSTFGLLLGYSFNNHWAVESGLYVDRKRYYTDGEYFNTKNVRVPPYSKLLNVDGTCYMWEIPVSVRYNFNTSQRMRWFGTAGLSTYLMSREKYTYQYETGGNTQDSLWNIHRPSQYLFTIVNLSAGFEQRMGKIGYLRLEPYVRIPLSGIGTGSLPILSAGMNIGFTRQLW